MLTRLRLRNFKRFGEVSIELGNPVVFIGPNDSGKTTALQALSLWEVGVKRWLEKRGDKPVPPKRSGVTLNRRDLLSVPVPEARYLWKDLHLRNVASVDGETRSTQNVRIEVSVEGVTEGETWRCGMEFDYANEESLYCRPPEEAGGKRGIPPAARAVEMAFLPPMSGLAPSEVRLDRGAIQVRLGEGRTAEVLRNLAYQVRERSEPAWELLVERIRQLFGVTLQEPVYVQERGELRMEYQERSGLRLDLSSAGRGLQQTLLLLSYLATQPGAVLLLDEPDAHLEILRQRQIYDTLSGAADETGSQVIIASHSEVLLNEAADRDVVVAFVGEPHRIDDRGTQVLKALKWIGFEDFYQAELVGWVLYLEGSTDLAILKAFATTLDHPASRHLERPFVHYIENQPQKARDHFFGLRDALPGLEGLVLVDRMERDLHTDSALVELMWGRREIESYLCQPATLMRFVDHQARERAHSQGPLFEASEAERALEAMDRSIADLVPRVALEDPRDSWWRTVKASDEFLDRLFERFYARLDLPNLMRKSDYHRLAPSVAPEDISPDVVEVLDRIAAVAGDSAAGPGS